MSPTRETVIRTPMAAGEKPSPASTTPKMTARRPEASERSPRISRMSCASPGRSRLSTGSAPARSDGLTPSSPSFHIRCVSLGSRDKIAVGLALAHHFLAIGVEGVIDDPLGGVLLVVVFETQLAEALSDGLQSWSLGLVPEGIVGIRAVHDLTEQDQRSVARQVVLLEDGLKRTLLAVMAQLHIFHVVGRGPFALGHFHHLVGWHKEKFGILV